MIKCSVCQLENDEFATICSGCRGFLQERVPHLYLFETIWGILHSPRRSFQRIVLAKRKNFSLLMFVLFGVCCSFGFLWFLKLGVFFENLPELLIWGVAFGIVGGMLGSPLLAFILHLTATILGGRSSYRVAYPVLSYSVIPIVLTLFLVLPIELLTFGMYLFTWNPDPYAIKPVSYVALIGFDVVMIGWSVGLLGMGTRIAYRIGWLKALLVAAITMISIVGMGYGAAVMLV
jgi:hypothetical protein